MEGDQSQTSTHSIDPEFSADEWLLLQTLAPKSRAQREIERETEEKIRQAEYLRRAKAGLEDLDGTGTSYDPIQSRATVTRGPDGKFVKGSGCKKPKGGFIAEAAAAAAPIVIPLLAPLVERGVDWMVKKFSGGAIRPPNADGGAIMPPNITGGAVAGAMKEHLAKLDSKLFELTPTSMYRALPKVLIEELEDILPEIVPQITPTNARKFAKTIADKILPSRKAFGKGTAPKKRGAKKYGSGAYALPLVKHALYTTLGKTPDVDELYRAAKIHVNSADRKGLYDRVSGSGPKWDKIKGWLGNAFRTAKDIVLKVAPEVAGPVTKTLMDLAGVKDNDVRTGIEKGVNKLVTGLRDKYSSSSTPDPAPSGSGTRKKAVKKGGYTIRLL